MQTRNRNPFTTIHTEGALLPVDLLQRIVDGDTGLGGLDPESYHLPGSEKLNEAINRSWNRLLGAWAAFQTSRGRLGEGDAGTTLTRERWLMPLFQELGYGRLQAAKAITLEGKEYRVSHAWGEAPIHLVGCGVNLDRRQSGVTGASKSSPHSLVQEYLNRNPNQLWGLLSNGLTLRVLRDNASLTRQAYLEFDLEAMLTGEVYADFVVLWLVCHQSRVETQEGKPETCRLEAWSKAAQEQGTRALDKLRDGVEQAITALGGGFLAHAGNTALKARLRSGALTREGYYRQLLRLVYRLIFLFAAEDRDLLLDPQATPPARERYLKYYSATHLRHLAEQSHGGRHPDLYATLRLVSAMLGGREPGDVGLKGLGLPVLGSFLFSAEALPDLETAELENSALLSAVRGLAFVLDGAAGHSATRRSVDYRNLGTRELGSVYESLLELHPQINMDAGTFELITAAGNERKTTGSYYTAEDLIKVLLDSALDPVIEEAVSRGKRMAQGEWRLVNGEWELANLEWKDDGEKSYARTVLSGFGSLAAQHGNSRTGLQVDQGLSEGGDVRSDIADTPGSSLDSSQYRGGLGEERVEGVSALPADRDWEPSRVGDTSDLEPASGDSKKRTSSTYPGKPDYPEQTDPIVDSQSGETLRLAAEAWNQTPLTTRHSLLAERSLLDLKVCDPACGSGHFLIAAARRIARRLAQLRSSDEEPSPEITRTALREVIRRCVYGVDINPMSVELCKVNLWLESIEPGKPLSFLDAHIRCGNSLVGVGPGAALEDLEVPDEAFNPVTGDDKTTAGLLKKRNKSERAGQESLFVTVLKSKQDLEQWLAQRARALEAMPEESAAEVQAKAEAYRQVNESSEYQRQRQAADLWAGAFFWPIEKPNRTANEILAPTQGQLRRLRSGQALQAGLTGRADALAQSQDFFHWPLEFPDVTAQGGFDCVLGNPPWERIKLQEEEFFASRDPEIAAAPNKAARERLIRQLETTNPALARAFAAAKHAAECSSKFVRVSQRYPLSAVGDVNTYALFAEHFRGLMNGQGRAGVIVPTGIATDDTTKDFFGDLVEKKAIASLFDFENREKLFPAVDSRMKFCLLTLSGAPVKQAQFTFFATRVEHLRDERRRFTLDPAEVALFNPNTRTMPIFRTRMDAKITTKIYRHVPVLENVEKRSNPWGVRFMAMLHMANDSGLFRTEPFLECVRLYEGKMVQAYDHRAANSVTKIENLKRPGQSIETTLSEHQNVDYFVTPQYFVDIAEVNSRIKDKTDKYFLLAYKSVTSPTNERTMIISALPICGVAHSMNIVFLNEKRTELWACFLANFNALVFDFVAKQKVGGVNLSFFFVRQFPVLAPGSYNQSDIKFISPRVLELVYTAYDMRPFAEDMGYHGEPFRWDEDRRAVLRAELDAYYARLYGLTRKQLRYILDPADLTGRELEDILDPWEEVSDPLDPSGYDARRAASDFPGETFRVLKDKEMRLYGEYRTRRLVLEAWERLEGAAPAAVNVPAVSVAAPKTEILSIESKAVVENVKEKSTPEPAAESQPMLSDFGLYKCGVCGKMVMGFEKEKHQNEKHGGKSVEWKKVR